MASRNDFEARTSAGRWLPNRRGSAGRPALRVGCEAAGQRFQRWFGRNVILMAALALAVSSAGAQGTPKPKPGYDEATANKTKEISERSQRYLKEQSERLQKDKETSDRILKQRSEKEKTNIAAAGQAVKKILDKGADIKAAGAKRAAAADAVGGKSPAKEVQAEPSASPAGAKGPAAAGKSRDKRDPFVVPIKAVDPNAPVALPPGNLGLMISQANLMGVIKSSKGMIAMIGGSSGRTYFLKENDKVFNGRVTKITADSTVFEETVISPLGQTSKREVVKKLSGEGK